MPNFEVTSFENGVNEIGRKLDNMEKDLIDVCKDFIKDMPEFKAITATVDHADKSDYTDENAFWTGISKAKDKDKITLDDLIKYISENYNEKAINEGMMNGLVENLKTTRDTAIKTVKRTAIDIIKMQEKTIEINERNIEEEKVELNKLQEELKKLQELKELSDKEMESKKRSAIWSKEAINEISTKIDSKKTEITKLKAKIDEHEAEQSKFVLAVAKNKSSLIETLLKNNIQLDEQQQTVNNNTQTNTQNNSRGNSVQTQGNSNQTQNNTPVTTATKCQSRQDARNILKNLRNSGNQNKILDDMGYGDIAAAIEFLGPISRRKLQTIIRNRREELGIAGLGEDHAEIIRRLQEFTDNYGTKTPKEIKEFEESVLQVLKYDSLNYDASRGFIRRKSSGISNLDDERMNHIKQMLIGYYDSKSQREEKKFDLINDIRVSVGKTPYKKRPEASRGNKNPESQLSRRDVPSNR